MKSLLTYAAVAALSLGAFSTQNAKADNVAYNTIGNDQTTVSTAKELTSKIAYDSEGGNKNIVETAMNADQFSTLASLIQSAGLAQALQAEGPFTVFAPTNDAFAKLPQETLRALQQPQNRGQLAAILTYHVVSGNVESSDLSGKTLSATTVQGRNLNIDATDGVSINNADVVKADIKASNGVIHAIDEVLIPQ